MQIPDHAKNKFILGSINPWVAGACYRKVAGLAGLLIYLYGRWKLGLPNYMTGKKSEWVKLDNVTMRKMGYGMDPKTKSKALIKLEKEKLIIVDLTPNSGKAPQIRFLIK
tara:strand:+ start:1093 stop:1422 length:330 start_codon:yes stop_codon:yes gene_type:complete